MDLRILGGIKPTVKKKPTYIAFYVKILAKNRVYSQFAFFHLGYQGGLAECPNHLVVQLALFIR
jgi:hypothetical protein